MLPAACSEEASLQSCFQSVNAVSKAMKDLNGEVMHQMFNHVNREKLYHTLENTKGFKAVWFDLPVCVWRALGKSTPSGLSNVKHKQTISAIIITEEDTYVIP